MAQNDTLVKQKLNQKNDHDAIKRTQRRRRTCDKRINYLQCFWSLSCMAYNTNDLWALWKHHSKPDAPIYNNTSEAYQITTGETRKEVKQNIIHTLIKHRLHSNKQLMSFLFELPQTQQNASDCEIEDSHWCSSSDLKCSHKC